MRFIDISFKKKIFMLLAVPLLGFIWLGVSLIISAISTYQEMQKLEQLTQLSAVYSELVHELQKERGMTAGFIGSKGTKFADKLKSQRKEASRKVTKKQSFWRDNSSGNQAIIRLNQNINQRLSQLSNVRNRVDSLDIPLSEALAFYTKTNAQLLSISTVISEVSTDAVITKETVAYYNFIQGKERAGIERAVLSNTFANDKFPPKMLTKFIKLVSEQQTYFHGFNAFANEKNKAFYVDKLNVAAVKEVLNLRKIAFSKSSTGQFGVEAEYWFAQSTKRIGQLKAIENNLSGTLLSLAQETKNSAFFVMIFSSIVTILLIMVASLVAFYIVRELNQQVNDLTRVMAKLRDEDDLTVRAKYTGQSELGQVSTALNLTLDKFSGAINEISTSSITLAAAAEETSQTCEQNLVSLVEQQDEIGLIATAIEELSVTVREVATNTQVAADSAKKVDSQTKEGQTVVKKSYLSIEGLASEISDLAVRISSLHESSNNITKVVDVIKSVAEQTNLLALNAAIEAARAGEQGRGFAVVADEVRTLAQRTQDSTSEIENFINSLQSDANSAFSVIENSQKMANEAVENSQHVEQMLTDISDSVSNIFSMTDQVAVAVEEQAMVTQDVAKNVVNVEQKSVESTSGSQQITTTAQEQANLAVSLQEVAVTFKT